MIVVDTSVLSAVFRRAKRAAPPPVAIRFAELLRQDEDLRVPGIVFQELLSGVKTPADSRRLEDALSGFPLLLATRATHLQGALIRNACRAGGIAAQTVDCLIAAHAIGHGATLLTLDADFRHIAKYTGLVLAEV